jgi:hypothetical protein
VWTELEYQTFPVPCQGPPPDPEQLGVGAPLDVAQANVAEWASGPSWGKPA